MVSCATTRRMAVPISAARSGSVSMRLISRRTHSSNASRNSEPSGLILSNSALTSPRTRRAIEAPSAQPTRRPPCSRTRSSMAERSASSRLAKRGFQLPEDEAEHLLVAASVDQAVQRPRHHLSRSGPAHDAGHHAREDPSRPAVLHRRQQLWQHA